MNTRKAGTPRGKHGGPFVRVSWVRSPSAVGGRRLTCEEEEAPDWLANSPGREQLKLPASGEGCAPRGINQYYLGSRRARCGGSTRTRWSPRRPVRTLAPCQGSFVKGSADCCRWSGFRPWRPRSVDTHCFYTHCLYDWHASRALLVHYSSLSQGARVHL